MNKNSIFKSSLLFAALLLFPLALLGDGFREALIGMYGNVESSTRVGIEWEIAGVNEAQLVDLVKKYLGGSRVYTQMKDGLPVTVIEGTKIGKVRIDRESVKRWIKRDATDSVSSRVSSLAADGVDRIKGEFEIVTEPLNGKQLEEFAQFTDRVGLETNAKGASTFRALSTQYNVDVPAEPGHIKNLLANYYRNGEVIRQETKPSFARRQFVQTPEAGFIRKLEDPNWKPTMLELYRAYTANGISRNHRVNVLPLFLTDPEIAKEYKRPYGSKETTARPAVEFREENSVVSSDSDRTRSSSAIRRGSRFTVALVDLSAKDGQILAANVMAQAAPDRVIAGATDGSSRGGGSRAPPGSAREMIGDQYLRGMAVRPLQGGSVVLTSPDILNSWGITGSEARVANTVMQRFGIEVDNSLSPSGTVVSDPNAPYATAHKDGFGGIGDGRTLNVGEIDGRVQNTKGTGLTPYIIKRYSSWLGWHVGGVDGKASLTEGLRSYAVGEVLNSYGIPSERVGALINNNGISASELIGDNPSAITVREIPGGAIRNSHLRVWDKDQTARGLDYLRRLAEKETGRAMSTFDYLDFDARRSAQIAARMIDAQIVHGAQTAGNILAYPGIVDLNTVQFIDVPDPSFTSLGMHSRYGVIDSRMKTLLLERQKAYAKADPRLGKVDLNREFDVAFKRELSVLSLQRMGMSPDVADRVYSENPERVNKWSQKLRQLRQNNLKTDFTSLIAEVPHRQADLKVDPKKTVSELVRVSSPADRQMPVSRHDRNQKIMNTLSRRGTAVSVSDASKFLEESTELLGRGLSVAASGGKSKQAALAEFQQQAVARRDFRPPPTAQIEREIKEVISARKQGEAQGEARIQRFQAMVENFKEEAKLIPRSTTPLGTVASAAPVPVGTSAKPSNRDDLDVCIKQSLKSILGVPGH